MPKPTRCCFCRTVLRTFREENNPEPLMNMPSKCCETCNRTKVLPARMAIYQMKKDNLPLLSKEQEWLDSRIQFSGI